MGAGNTKVFPGLGVQLCCGLYKFYRTLHTWLVTTGQNPLVFQSFLPAAAVLKSKKNMKRCCLFFLAFVAAVFLAVLTGSFEHRPGTINQVVDTADMSIASQEKKQLPEQEQLKTSETDISKNRIP